MSARRNKGGASAPSNRPTLADHIIGTLWLILGAALIGLIIAAPVMRAKCEKTLAWDIVIPAGQDTAEMRQVEVCK